MTQKYPSSSQFRRELDRGRLDRIYLFLGEEEGEKDKFINLITGLVLGGSDDPSGSVGRFHAENDELMQAADFALSQSMFSNSRLCILRNVEAMKNPRSSERLFSEMIDDLPESTRIIMTSANNRPPDFIPAGLLDKMKIVQFWRYFDRDLYNYVRINARKNGVDMDDRAIDLLIELTGKDIRKIDDALDMIKYSGESRAVDSEIIRSYISDVKEVSVYDFLDLLFKRDRMAFRYFKKLMDDGTPELLVLGRILWQAELLEKYHAQISDGALPDEAMKNCGVTTRNRDNFLAYARTMPADRIRPLFFHIGRADARIKSGSYSTLASNPLFDLVHDVVSGNDQLIYKTW
ncbi:MAG: DNA polymerase III subunit delta [Spirochaetes bacterium]|jgi:DNA polymerase III delta subunit|nr:DNA polymerase III subunit delta [Spirochaetota bacterium]